jgi:predicted Zn finger-like uncharacterized protein
MYTQCPACSTYFRITPEQLQAAGGKVRCGECRHVFHAPDFLTDTLPGVPAAADEPVHGEPDYEQLLREPQPEAAAAAAEEIIAQQPAPPAAPFAEEPAPLSPATEATSEKTEDSLAIDLEALFGSDAETDAAPEAPEPPPAETATVSPPAEAVSPPPGATYGEEDIEALLTFGPQGGTADSAPQAFELPWDEPPVDTAPAIAPDIDAVPDTLDLPESAPATARSVSPAPVLSPLSAMLAEEQAAPRRSLLAGLAWTLASLLLIAALAVQYAYLNRLALVRHAELRPLLELMCQHTGCRLPPRRDLAALTLLERDIRSHDRYQGALTINATLQNRAAFAQPYPAVDVVMRDLGGKVVAARRFLPQEYLAGRVPPLLAPQATAQLVLDVVDPGAEAVGFEFTFH